MASFNEIVNKKVAGVPVLYLAGAFVAILAIVAWKMKPAPEPDVPTGDEGTTSDNVPISGSDSPAADYGNLATNGTVTVVQSPAPAADAVQPTNDQWERSAVEYLIEAKLATPSEAQSAIHKYLEGANLSYEEGRLKDAAITKLKLPPEPLVTIGSIGTAPAQKQFNNFPGRHTVKGSNDNTPAKLATLYYGNGGAAYALKIASANSRLGPVSATYTPGTAVTIPEWTNPKYFTVTKTTTWPSQVAAKNGITYSQFIALNPGITAPYKVGLKVRVG